MLTDGKEDPHTDNLRGTFGRLKIFHENDVHITDKVVGKGSYAYAVLATVTGVPGQVVVRRNLKPLKSWKSLNAIDKMGPHPNILRILGCVTLDGTDLCVISELCERGNLLELSRNGEIKPSDAVLLGYAKSIALGLVHLHRNQIIHRDLRAANILVHSDGRVVIADFGLSRKLSDSPYYQGSSDQAMPERWMAPECLRNQRYTFKGDIWSFAVMLYELLTCGCSPYYVEVGRRDWSTVRTGVIEGSIRLFDDNFGEDFDLKGASKPTKVISLAKDCMVFNEEKRPDARWVLGRVEQGICPRPMDYHGDYEGAFG
ncbi:hypothetical protein AAMO2058_000962700 [Amorphochlora amoebiformis]